MSLFKVREGREPYRISSPPMQGTVLVPIRPVASQGVFLALSGVTALILSSMAVKAISGSAMRALTPATRQALPYGDFAVPQERKYPINDLAHARLALTYVASPSNIKYRYQVMMRVFPRYPSLISWWATTKLGRQEPLSAAMFRSKIQEYRSRLRGQRGAQRQGTEDEIAALQELEKMAPRLRRLSINK
jgi:hypothetical protein